MKTLFRRLKDYLIPPDPQGGCTWPSVDLTLPGDISLHLVGSIHMGSETMYPLPGPLLERINRADGLIVEADITRPAPPFPGQDPEHPRLPVSERLPEHLRDDYRRYCEEQRQPVQTLDTLPAWQVALILQSAQAQSLGLRPHYGIDYQMLNAAHGQNIPVFELEGTQAQMQMLLDFPDEGLSLLEDTLAYWHDNARALQIMLGWWLDYRPEKLAQPLPATFSEQTYQHLMISRNDAWKTRLVQLPPGNYVVAVGALHLYGDHNLPSILC